MVKYSNSIIYSIKSRGKTYIGCTTNFSSCKYNHKEILLLTERPSKLYNTIRHNNFEWEMKELHKYPCRNKTELLKELYRVIELTNPELN